MVETKDSERKLEKGLSWKQFREQSERQFLVKALRDSNGNISGAATALDIERTYLHKKIAQYGIEKREYFL